MKSLSRVFSLRAVTFVFIAALAVNTAAQQIDIPGPAGSQFFGWFIAALPNGNFVATDPDYDAGPVADVGAVYLYDGATLQIISTLTGSTALDRVGQDGVIVLANGNFVVRSGVWDNGNIANAGAVTFCSGTTGCNGTVTPGNSLVGTTATDSVGIFGGATALANGNYVVGSSRWTNPATGVMVGAATWCSGVTGCVGTVTSTNSLIGTSPSDNVGISVALSNGNYVLRTPFFDGDSGFANDAGAVTWCSGTSGCTGTIGPANSLLGPSSGDNVGTSVMPLSGGGYVVMSPNWDNAAASVPNVGAASFCNGPSGCNGMVAASNSLVGNSANDRIGANFAALTNGNYAVGSSAWDNPAGPVADVGLVKLCSGTTGCTGVVTAADSFIGATTSDGVGLFIAPLSDGNLIIGSPNWDNPSPALANVGAVTWCNGATTCVGTVSSSNSFIGGTAGDALGSQWVRGLANGGYIFGSPGWDNAAALTANVGAVTFCGNPSGCTGTVSVDNSLIGTTPMDSVGVGNPAVLPNGNYVVSSPMWDYAAAGIVNAGAATWCSGTTGCVGPVSAINSLVGNSPSDQVGNPRPLGTGYYSVETTLWDNQALSVPDAKEVTLGNGVIGTTGTPLSTMSVLGTITNSINSHAYDPVNDRFIVGRYRNNLITVLTPNLLQTPDITVSDSSGNNNGFPEPGELLTLTVALTNNTRSAAIGTTLQVPGSVPVTYGNIGEGQTVVREVLYRVPASSPCGSEQTVALNVNSSLGPIAFSGQLLLGAPGTVAATENFDSVTAPAFPSGWSALPRQGVVNFVTSTSSPDTAPNAAFALDPTTVGGGTDLTSGWAHITSPSATISFRNSFNTEQGWDGGLLEISIDRGPFRDILTAGGSFTQNGYNGTLGANGANNPLAGRSAWTGNSAGYITTIAQLPSAANGKLVRFRWRFGADDNTAPAGGGWSIDTIAISGGGFVTSFNCVAAAQAPFDFDGDGKTDVGIFRPSVGEWWINQSSNGVTTAGQFGASTDIITPADFTGDGKTDIAFFQPSSGFWFVLRSEDFSYFAFPFGTNGDVPVPADYDGDGKADATVFRPSSSTWFIQRSTDGGATIAQFGSAGDVPVPADYDDDGKADIAIYRPSLGQWWMNRSTAGVVAVTFGDASDKAVQGDYTGDGKADVAFWRPSTGFWFILRSEDFSFYSVPFGTTGDVPAPGDYDGDGKHDTTVFRPSTATWYSQRSTAGTMIQQFGANGDRPLPNAFVP